jgi:2-methylcitrate dehydratase PrpD
VNRTVVEFSKILAWNDIPAKAPRQAKRCLLDLIGAAAAGMTTGLTGFRAHAAHQSGVSAGGPGVRMIIDDRRVSATGAAIANAFTIDGIDTHDGHPLSKGHTGCGDLPGGLAIIEENELHLTGQEFLACLAVGYEIAIRAGIALHATVPDGPTSGGSG